MDGTSIKDYIITLETRSNKTLAVLEWKETITKAKEKMCHNKKLDTNHHYSKERPERPKWCYLPSKNIDALARASLFFYMRIVERIVDEKLLGTP